MDNSFYSREELLELGFKHIGENVLLSKKASIYGAENITIGNNSRIDDFTLLTGKVDIGDYVHVAAYAALYGGTEGITVKEFTTVSSRVVVYSICDDLSGAAMVGPLVDDEFRNLDSRPVYVGRETALCSGTVVFPGSIVSDGVIVGACSLVKGELEPWSIYGGVPAKKLKDRKKDVIELEKRFLEKVK